MEVTEKKVSEEQEGFRKGRGCVDQVFAMKMLVEKYLGRDKICIQPPCLFSIFMDGCMSEMKRKVVNVGARFRLNGED